MRQATSGYWPNCEVFGSILSAGARGFGAISFLAVLRAFLGAQLLRIGFVGIVVAACQFAVRCQLAHWIILLPSRVVIIARHPVTDLVTYRPCDLNQRRPSRTMMRPHPRRTLSSARSA